jgi:hypothetical protein
MLAFEPVTITDDPVEYVLELNDICSDQKSDSVRCLSMKLLTSISENTDGFLTFACTICYDFIQKALAQDVVFF